MVETELDKHFRERLNIVFEAARVEARKSCEEQHEKILESIGYVRQHLISNRILKG